MEQKNTPKSIGVIVDGNRRWARARGLSTLEGHKAGLKNLQDFLSWSHDAGIMCVYAYMFSTENWNRAPEEVSYLMALFKDMVKEEFSKLTKQNIRIKFLGTRERFGADMQKIMSEVEEDSKNCTGMTVAACLSYGGRTEIVSAMNTLLQSEKKSVSEDDFSEAVWSRGLPDPDLIIRTGGEKRLSNFLTWQSVYSELFFVDTMFPDFSEAEFEVILQEYAARERRRGK